MDIDYRMDSNIICDGKPVPTFLRFLRSFLFELTTDTEQRLRATYDRLVGDEKLEKLLAELESESRPEYVITLGQAVLDLASPTAECSPPVLPLGLCKFLLVLHDKIREVVHNVEKILMAWEDPVGQQLLGTLFDKEFSYDTLFHFCKRVSELVPEVRNEFSRFAALFDTRVGRKPEPWFSPFGSQFVADPIEIRLTPEEIYAILDMKDTQ